MLWSRGALFASRTRHDCGAWHNCGKRRSTGSLTSVMAYSSTPNRKDPRPTYLRCSRARSLRLERPRTRRRDSGSRSRRDESLEACVLHPPVTSGTKMIKAGTGTDAGRFQLREYSSRWLMAKYIRVGDNCLALVQRADLTHLLLGQLEVKDVDVLGNPSGIG